MPRRPRQYENPWQDRIRDTLDDVLRTGIGVVADAVRQAAPQCAYCGATTPFFCQNCRTPVCHAHAHVNTTTLSAICNGCLAQHFPFVSVEVQPPPDGDAWTHPQKPWELLDVEWNASEAEINAAFKQKARSAHPDIGGSDEEMKLLAAAREYMLRMRRGGR